MTLNPYEEKNPFRRRESLIGETVHCLLGHTDNIYEGYKFACIKSDKKEVLKYFIDNFIDDIDKLINLYGLIGPIDYNNEEHLKAIEDEILKTDFQLRKMTPNPYFIVAAPWNFHTPRQALKACQLRQLELKSKLQSEMDREKILVENVKTAMEQEILGNVIK